MWARTVSDKNLGGGLQIRVVVLCVHICCTRSTTVVKAHFPRKVLATHRGLFTPGSVFAVLNYHRLSQKCIGSNFNRLSIALSILFWIRIRSGYITVPLQWLHKWCFYKNASWCTKQICSARYFALFCFAKSTLVVSTATSSSAKLDSN